MSWIEQLIGDLRGEGAHIVALSQEKETYAVSRCSGMAFDPPVRLMLSENDFARHLERLASDGAIVFPEVRPREGAYRLFLVHLDEAFATRATPSARISVTERGIVVSGETPSPIVRASSGDRLHWTAERPPQRS